MGGDAGTREGVWGGGGADIFERVRVEVGPGGKESVHVRWDSVIHRDNISFHCANQDFVTD